MQAMAAARCVHLASTSPPAHHVTTYFFSVFAERLIVGTEPRVPSSVSPFAVGTAMPRQGPDHAIASARSISTEPRVQSTARARVTTLGQ
jgi:hypothetical protein